MEGEKNQLNNLMAFFMLIAYAFAVAKWVSADASFPDIDKQSIITRKMEDSFSEFDDSPLMAAMGDDQVLMVPITLIEGAKANGAVCLDGTLPAYHWDRGFGPGEKNWLINLEGGGWCNNLRTCVYRKTSRRGSSNYMEKQLPFTGILSNNSSLNPDFYNWNRVKVRYCDGASFAGDGENKDRGLQFKGQRIFEAAMQEFMSKGMQSANNVLLAGCSAGGLATILHCDEFKAFFPTSTKVKCLADAGLFMDAVDVSGGHAIRNFFSGVVTMQNVQQNLPNTCISRLDPTSCFFPQNLIDDIKTPIFILNAAYDSWQVEESLAPPSADPRGEWSKCRTNHQLCSTSQISFLQDFRNSMVNAVKNFSQLTQNGLFINSCFAHCQSERQDTWFAPGSPVLGNKAIATAVGDWYFDRSRVVDIDCPYPCDSSCHHIS